MKLIAQMMGFVNSVSCEAAAVKISDNNHSQMAVVFSFNELATNQTLV